MNWLEFHARAPMEVVREVAFLRQRAYLSGVSSFYSQEVSRE